MEAFFAWLQANLLGAITLTICLTYMFLGLPHQIWTIWKKRSVEGVSVQMFILLAVQSFFWVLYGIQQGDWFVIIANSFGTLFSTTIVVEYWVITTRTVR